jgi:Protein of unknown function (DUF3025)
VKAIDWTRPWLARLQATREAAAPVRFVAATELPEGEAYEAFIARTGCVPTRHDNLHDHFNSLVWRRHPRLKQRLNQLQAQDIARHGVRATRGALRDGLTLFDENGALWPDAPLPLLEALVRRDWQSLFVTRRALWRDHGFEIFGHALLEQLAVAPRKGLVAHVIVGADPLALTAAQWAAKPFLPLPVLGVPGWWPANEAPSFYDDAAVFRAFRPKPLKAKPLKAKAAP